MILDINKVRNGFTIFKGDCPENMDMYVALDKKEAMKIIEKLIKENYERQQNEESD